MPRRVVLVAGFEADQQIHAAALHHQVEQPLFLQAVGGHQSAPLLLERDHRGEQFSRIFLIVHQADVVERDNPSRSCPDVAHHVGDRPLEVARPHRGHRAEVAPAPAAPGSLHGVGHHVSGTPLQVAPGSRDAGKHIVCQVVLAVDALHPAAAEISNELRPCRFPAAHNNAIRMLDGLARQNGNVHAAEYHRNAALPVVPGNCIGRRRASRDDADADEIRG